MIKQCKFNIYNGIVNEMEGNRRRDVNWNRLGLNQKCFRNVAVYMYVIGSDAEFHHQLVGGRDYQEVVAGRAEHVHSVGHRHLLRARSDYHGGRRTAAAQAVQRHPQVRGTQRAVHLPARPALHHDHRRRTLRQVRLGPRTHTQRSTEVVHILRHCSEVSVSVPRASSVFLLGGTLSGG